MAGLSIRFNLDDVACFAFPEQINFEMFQEKMKKPLKNQGFIIFGSRDGLEPPT